MTHLEGSLAWHDQGCSIIPIYADGTKKPQGKWTEYMTTRAPRERVEKWFSTSPKSGIGIVCGAVSGNLEMLEIEAARMGSEYLDKVAVALTEAGVDELWDQLTSDYGYCETTPSGGIHILYRITDQPVPGNQKIAMDPTGKVTYAETRGEGGFVVVAPSSGTVHKSGQAWTAIAGTPGMPLLSITWDLRQKIHAALKEALDERVLPVYERPAAAPYDRANGMRPGDAYDNDPSVTVHDILLRNGWKYLGKSGGQDRYVHPLSSDMSTHSAVTGHKGSPNLYAWSGLPKEDYYTPFGLLTYLEFNGDFSAATRWLREQGYGDPLPPRQGLDISDWEFDDEQATANPVGDKPKRLPEWTETGVGELIASKFGHMYRSVPEQKIWRVYAEGLWLRDETQQVARSGKQVTASILAEARKIKADAEVEGDKDQIKMADALIRRAESFRTDRGARAVISRFATEEGVTVPPSAFDGDVNLLRFTNGTLDLSTLVLREHRPEDMITLDIPYAYDPDATCPRFMRFLEESIPNSDVRGYLNRVQGYATTGDPTAGAWFVLHGDTGCGKTTYLSIASAALGDHARTAAPSTFAQRNEGSRAANDLQDIRHARMVMISETKEGQAFNESLIKQYSGGDEMNSHGLYQENGTWKNRGVLFMATNHPPRLSADDNANWRRVKMIHFPISQYEEGSNRVPDPDLVKKIVGSELPGVMNWIIQGIREYRSLGLKEPQEVVEAVKSHRVDVDPVSQFITEGASDGYIKIDKELKIHSHQLYTIFSNWCRDNSITPLGARRFALRLTALRFGQGKDRQGIRTRSGIGVGTRGAGGTMSQGWER